MNPNVSDKFREIFETINDILSFLSLTNIDNLIDNDIEKIFFKSHYIEEFICHLKIRNFTDVFELKAKEYFENKNKYLMPTVPVMELYSDEVLSKIITLQPSYHITTVALKLYLNHCSYKRFEELIKKLAKFRTLYVNVSQQFKDIISPLEIESILLVECWMKSVNYGEEGFDAMNLILKKMFLDLKCIEILIKIVYLDLSDDYRKIQESIVTSLTSELCNKNYLPSWKVILESEQLELIISKFPACIKAVLSIIEIFGNEIEYNTNSKTFELPISCGLDYKSFITIFQKLFKFQALHYKLKKLIYINKIKRNVEIWKNIDKDLCPCNTLYQWL